DRLVLTMHVVEAAVERDLRPRLRLGGELPSEERGVRLLVPVDAERADERARGGEVDEMAEPAVEAVQLGTRARPLEAEPRVRLDPSFRRQSRAADLVPRLREMGPVREELEQRRRAPGSSHVRAERPAGGEIVDQAQRAAELPEVPLLLREGEARVGVGVDFLEIAPDS